MPAASAPLPAGEEAPEAEPGSGFGGIWGRICCGCVRTHCEASSGSADDPFPVRMAPAHPAGTFPAGHGWGWMGKEG